MDLTGLTLRRGVNALKIHTIQKNQFPPRKWDAFVFYLSGECTYIYEGLQFRARAGDLVYLPSGKPYAAHFITPAASCLLVNFEADFPGERTPLCRKMENPGQIQDLFEALIRFDRKQDRSRQAWMLSALYQLIALAEAPSAYLPGSKKEKLKSAMALLDREYCHASLRCTDLAAACQMSDKYFQQLFKSVYGMPPRDYITLKRLQRAKQLLAETDASIGAIAQNCGFSSLYYFSRVFKSICAQTPSEYRKSAGIT